MVLKYHIYHDILVPHIDSRVKIIDNERPGASSIVLQNTCQNAPTVFSEMKIILPKRPHFFYCQNGTFNFFFLHKR